MACPCCNPSACLPGFACILNSAAYFDYQISISTPPLTYSRFAGTGSCTVPITVPAATVSINFVSTFWNRNAGYPSYPSRAKGPRLSGGWRSSTIYTAGGGGLTPYDIGTGVRDFFFAHYPTEESGGRTCRAVILGSMSLLLDANLNTPTLSNVDPQGTTYSSGASPVCAEAQPDLFKVAVYFASLPRLYDRTVYNCVSGVYDLFHLDLVSTGGFLPPEDATGTSYVPNGPKVGTITISKPA